MIDTTTDILDELWNMVPEDQQHSLNRDAFNDIALVYLAFIDSHNSGKPTHWVCDAAPGHGKTTVLTTVLKRFSSGRDRMPVLLVFNNKDTMKDLFSKIHNYATQNEIPDLIQYVDAENVESELPTLRRYLFVCITQQRLRDLALKQGDWTAFSMYEPVSALTGSVFETEATFRQKRMIIIDEMPIFFDECIFDIGAKDNAVAWFDDLAKDAKMTEIERYFGRNTIMQMVLQEFMDNETSTVTALMKHLDGSKAWERFKTTLEQVMERVKYAKWETKTSYRWFMRLLNEDAQGCIDRHNNGQSILCSDVIDYKRLGNVLILDGTAGVTEFLYTGNGYTMKHVLNRHDYNERLRVHWRFINTNSAQRRKPDKSVQTTVARDIAEFRQEGINPFPLVLKDDINAYTENGVISNEFAPFYKGRDGSGNDGASDERLAINLFNTTGKNDLRKFDALALTSLPIRHPQYYKLKAIGLYGTHSDISMSNDNEDGWFQDLNLEVLFLQLSMAELIQILHRSDLRDLNSETEVALYLYHNQESWMSRLQTELGLAKPHTSMTVLNNDSLYGFEEKCKAWAVLYEIFLTRQDGKMNLMTRSNTP